MALLTLADIRAAILEGKKIQLPDNERLEAVGSDAFSVAIKSDYEDDAVVSLGEWFYGKTGREFNPTISGRVV